MAIRAPDGANNGPKQLIRKSITSASIGQLVGYALGSKKEIYPRDGEKSNHHHHQMLPSSRKNGQLSYRL